MKFINREISWLSFNERVLQEASDAEVPLIERMRFLGIFSSNMDEFFRVRVATLKRMEDLGKKAKKILGGSPRKVLDDIYAIVVEQQNKFEKTYDTLLKELEKENIFIINETQLNEAQGKIVREYFQQEVRSALVPIMIGSLPEFPYLKDRAVYLAILLSDSKKKEKPRYALIEIPTDILSRFLVLPESEGKKFVILLDDIIRFGLKDIFSIFPYDTFSAYTIKITRDAEIDIEGDYTESFMEKVSKGLKQRKRGKPVRFNFDEQINTELLHFLLRKMNLKIGDDNIIPGQRYHNFRDFMQFPVLGKAHLVNKKINPLPHPDFVTGKSLFYSIRQKDILLHYPYQSFDYFIDLLREAAIDTKVTSIKITLYRLASKSKVVNTLINAVRNGKEVTVVMELQARFDEEANINWSDRLREEGANVILGVQGLKVHSKMCLITRREKGKNVSYANIATGNYNESTSRFYCDHSLFTVDKSIVNEVEDLFLFMENNYKLFQFKHLLVAPFQMRKKIVKLIEEETANAKKGKPASIQIKLNNFVDPEMNELLREAAKKGVKIKMIVRSTCAFDADDPELNGNVSVISIVDKFLEHSRLFIFHNNGNPKYFITSADWMVRNLDHRVEMVCPVYDKNLQQELQTYFDIQQSDNTKARIINSLQDNKYVRTGEVRVRSQDAIYKWLQKRKTSKDEQKDSNG